MKNKGTHNYKKDNRNETIQIYINGDFYPRNNAKISVFDSGFLLGDGVWEGIRLLNGKMVFFKEHLDRLFHGARELSIDIGKNKEQFTNLILNTLNVNNMKTGVHVGSRSGLGCKLAELSKKMFFVHCYLIINKRNWFIVFIHYFNIHFYIAIMRSV